MATVIARIKIPNAAMAAMSPAQGFWINSNGTVTQQTALVAPSTTWEASTYRSVKVIVAIGSPGLTTAAGGIIGFQPSVMPEYNNPPAAGMVMWAGADGTNLVSGIAASAVTLSGSKALNTEATGANSTVIWSTFGMSLLFTTVPTAGADMYIWLLGYGWKSYE